MSEQIVLKEYIRRPVPDMLSYRGANYWREGRGERIGVMIALDKNRWGFSIISPLEDLTEKEANTREIIVKGKPKSVKTLKRKWTSDSIWERGTFIALERAMGDAPNPKIIPKVAIPSIKKFERRMKAYFK